ncbi:class II aldolase/adducin family protein [Mariniblastus sp.]|nr:class II aldolase/adducin family protein [Mariniblastus sp.]
MTTTEELRHQICEIGKRAWTRGFVAASDGNISARLDEDRVLCTPTMTCKGFLSPESLCIVDMAGKLIEGEQKPTSEIRLHLSVYRQRADIRSVFHSHAPYATAFAVTGQTVPRNVLAEPELFLGNVPIAPYAITGSEEFSRSIDPFVQTTNAILLANHGVVTYHDSVETAFWLTEMLDAYCRILINAKALGPVQTLSDSQVEELSVLRKRWGYQP